MDGHVPALGYTTAKTSEEHGQNPAIGLNIIEWLCCLLYLNAKYGTNRAVQQVLCYKETMEYRGLGCAKKFINVTVVVLCVHCESIKSIGVLCGAKV